MNFLRRNRRNRTDEPVAGTTTTTHEKHHGRAKKDRVAYDINSGEFNRRPSFGQW